MKRKCLIYGGLGALVGVCLSFIIPLFISLIGNDGQYYPVTLEMSASLGGELNAVVVQVLVSILYGVVCGTASLVFEMDRWSLTKQTVIHLILFSSSTFIAAYLCYWMDHDFISILSYFAILLGIYVFIWVSQYISIYYQIKKMNKKIESN